MIKRILLNPWTAAITLCLVIAVRIIDPTFVESVRLRYFDTLITSKTPTVNNVWTVDIDETMIAQHGQWPFARSVYADLIESLYTRNAGLVVFNVLMPEPDRAGKDELLIKTVTQRPVVLSTVPGDTAKNTARHPGAAVINSDYSDRIIKYPAIIANIPNLEQSAVGSGIVSVLPEVDGVVRRVPLVVTVDDNLYPSLALETLRVAAGDTNFQIKLNELGVEALRIPQFGPIPTDALARVWVDWSQQANTTSAADLPKDFGGAIVIVGVTAAGVSNPVATAQGAVWPHHMQAAVIGTMVNQVNIQRPSWMDGAEILLLTALSLMVLLLSRWVYAGVAATLVILAAIVPATQWVYSQHFILMDATLIVAGLFVVAMHAYFVKFIKEYLQKQQIKRQFGSYVSPVIVERLQKNPELIRLGGEERMLTAVMTDMRNFTGLGEKYGADVEGFTAIMNAYMTAISKPVFANDGCLIKFIGDASLHIHGAPLDDERHAYHAVKTTLEMIKAVEEFNQHLASIGKPPVGMGAGVNTGKILVGNIGAEGKMGYDVLGDPVSVASRLESQTKSYGVLMIIGPETAESVKDDFELVWLDNIAVKGKAVGLDIYTVGHTVAYMHEEYKKEYLRGNWAIAKRWVEQLLKEPEVEVKDYYTKMIERLDQGVPDDWTGTYHATSK